MGFFIKITNLDVNKFRHLSDVSFEIGSKITAISGQNGTGKSTILGLLGHVCKLKSKDKTFDNKYFETEYSEIFKFSFPTYDRPKEHLYDVTFDDGTTRQVISQARKEKNKPESLRLRVGSVKGQAKVDFPVIFLGLKRLYPLAQERKVNSELSSLSEEETQFFSESHNSILLMNEVVHTQEVKSSNKHFLAATSESYDAYGNSAGQDNVGQIITSIISFKRLKDNMGENYKGGLLLIDEIDATLHPAAQKKLLEFLFKSSAKLSLQVVFTTHSIEILEILLTSKYRFESKVCYLYRSHGKVELATGDRVEPMIADLKANVLKQSLKPQTVDIYFEDKEAVQFFGSLINSTIRKKIKVQNVPFGAEELKNLARKKVAAFNNSVIVLDGDVDKPKGITNIVILPGGDSPEKIIFKYLKELPEDHPFWSSDLGGYNKQICFSDIPPTGGNREVMKIWWKDNFKHWGSNGRKLFRYWVSDNGDDAEKFVQNFTKVLDKKLKL